MICNIDLFGDTKVSKAFTVIRIEADGQQTSTHQIFEYL